MKTELEVVFFESTIVDIDFSQWRNFLQLIVISDWALFKKQMIPLTHVNLVRLNGLREFHCKSNFESLGDPSELPGMPVSSIHESNIGSEKYLLIEGSPFELFRIKYSHHEIISGTDISLQIPKKNIDARLFLAERKRIES